MFWQEYALKGCDCLSKLLLVHLMCDKELDVIIYDIRRLCLQGKSSANPVLLRFSTL